MHEAVADGLGIDAGPTVLTMRWVFESLFAACGADLDAHVPMTQADVLARHAWSDDTRLDLFADLAQSRDAVGAFAGAAEARRFDTFHAEAAAIYRTLEAPFLRDSKPSPIGLAGRVGLGGMGSLLGIRPFTTLWQALGKHFQDARLRQLYGRYATYCGSSPFLAPATLMLVAHVEQQGVWLVDGGMQRLAETMAALAGQRGVDVRYGTPVTRITTAKGQVSGVRTAVDEHLAADAVVFNGDPALLGQGLLEDLRLTMPTGQPSLSAITVALRGKPEGLPLARHTVVFGDDYAEEFDAVFRRGGLPHMPTTYICAQDRDAAGTNHPDDRERLFLLVNAPPESLGSLTEREIDACLDRSKALLNQAGLTIHPASMPVRTTPAMFAQRFPGSSGALYGTASHGWRATFQRPGATTRVPGLMLAGGGVHPGPGVPMAALSGLQAARAVLDWCASTHR